MLQPVTHSIPPRWTVIALLLSVLLTGVTATAQELTTPAEDSDFTEYTRHSELVEYIHEVQAQARDMRLGTYGQTREGRDLYYALYSRDNVSGPADAHESDKPFLVLAANVHGNERTLRESLLIMMRGLGERGHELNDMLDDMNVMVVPSINPDGFEATERGTRGNKWGIDLNRDYMKLEHPSIYYYVQRIINEWHPHLYIDGHNGGSYPYNLKYQAPSHAFADQSLTELADNEIFPRIDENMEAEGYRSFFWARGDEDAWYSGSSDPRIGRNYGGLANKVSILFESPSWQDMEPGVKSGIIAYRTILEYTQDSGDQLMATVRQARERTIELGNNAEGTIPVDMEYGPEDELVDYLIPASGDDERDKIEVTGAELLKKPVPTKERRRPYVYILPRDAEEAVRLLRRHNITVEKLTEQVELTTEAYTLKDIDYENFHNHRSAMNITTSTIRRDRHSYPEGTFIIRTGQLLGRVASYLLEPETTESLLYWNKMTFLVPKADLQSYRQNPENNERPVIPIYKLMESRELSTRIFE